MAVSALPRQDLLGNITVKRMAILYHLISDNLLQFCMGAGMHYPINYTAKYTFGGLGWISARFMYDLF